jgi:hypothetical protein
LFEEHFKECRVDSDAWILLDRKAPIDKQVSDWSDQTGALIHTVNVAVNRGSSVYNRIENRQERDVVVSYVILYEDGNIAASQPTVKKALTVEARRVAPDGTSQQVEHVMAGICCAPEGSKLHPDDDCIAFPPLLSPDLDLQRYVGLFGNIPEKGGKS